MGKKVKWCKGKSLMEENQLNFNNFCQDISDFDLSKKLCGILYNRGIDTYEKVERHLFMELCDIHNPALFKDSDKFVKGVKKAIDEKHKIIIMGDYDVDGITATSIALLGLRNIGLDVDFYINNRFVEGYGMTNLSLDNILKKYPDVKTIITVDNGIVAFDAVKKAVDMGIQVLVTDHHEPSSDGKYPQAHAVVDHKRFDCEYPFKEICGAGVIFKLLLLLYWELELELDDVYELLDLVAVGTVADVVSLTDENRVFVKEGLELIRKDHRLFFKILNEVMAINQIDEETIGFQYGPAMNAIGRLDGCPSEVVEAIVSNDEDFVRKICEKMVATNNKRKELTSEHVEQAELILANQEDRNVIVVYSECFLEGLVGLIAGRLCERYYKPVVALTKHGDVIKGSARSIPGFDVKESFDYSAEYLLGYGGHPQAGGLSLKAENLDAFIKKINEYGDKHMTPEISQKKVEFDYVLKSSDINATTVDEVAQLKPYGQGFKKPLFGFKVDIPPSGFFEGVKKNVLILTSTNGIKVIGFDNKKQYIAMGQPSRVAMLGCPSTNVYNGDVTYQFIIDQDNIRADKSTTKIS